jgi:uncharacterized membrane protein YfhO
VFDIEGIKLKSIVETQRSDLPNYYIYENLNRLNRFRFASKYTVISDFQELEEFVRYENFSFENNVILETDPQESFEKLSIAKINILQDLEQKLVLKTNTDKRAIFVISDSYDPSWRAAINGQDTKIFPANINQRAIIIPPGQNIIELNYYPRSFNIGVLVCISASLTFATLALIDSKYKSSASIK